MGRRADGSHENASHFHATNDARNLEASALVYAMYYICVYIGGRKAGRKDSLASNSEPQSRMKFGKARSGRRRFLWDQNIRIIFHRFDHFLSLSNSLFFSGSNVSSRIFLHLVPWRRKFSNILLNLGQILATVRRQKMMGIFVYTRRPIFLTEYYLRCSKKRG